MHALRSVVSTYVALPAYFACLYLLLARAAPLLGPFSTSTQISIGLLVGYFYSAISESWQHRFWGHSATRLRDIIWRLPGLGIYTWKAYWLHNVIHHARTHRKSTTTLFSSAEEERALHASLTPDQSHFVSFRRYGLTIPWTGFGAFLWLPLIALPWLWRYAGEWAAYASIPPMFMSPLITKFIHPLMHRPYESALRECSGLTHWFMRTAYARWVIRHHWLHHRYPKYNFNFMMGGDLLLGVHRCASEADLKAMAAEGIALH